MSRPDIEQRLRRAMWLRATAVDPTGTPDDVRRRMAAVRAERRRRTHVLVAAAAVVVIALGAGAAWLVRDGDEDVVVTPATTTATTAAPPETTAATTSPPTTAAPVTTAAPTTAAPPTTAPTTTAPAPEPVPVEAAGRPVVWPAPGSIVAYESPEAAALAFADAFLVMADPQVLGSAERADDPGITSVEVVSRPTSTLVTHVLVTGIDSSFVVVGAESDAIVLDSPRAGDRISSEQLTIRGTSTAFEATFGAELRVPGSIDAYADRVPVMGGSMGEMAPFEATLDVPPDPPGVLVVTLIDPDMSGEGDAASATVVGVLTG